MMVSTLRDLLNAVSSLRRAIDDDAAARLEGWKDMVGEGGLPEGAVNLANYLALRERDVTPLQPALARFGLSSLGRSESRVLPTLDAVLATLSALVGEEARVARPDAETFDAGLERLERSAEVLFGPRNDPRRSRIMVTLEPDIALDHDELERMLAAGTDCVRINCAHDAPQTWRAMARAVREAARARGRTCRVLMDLAGPKIRTVDPHTPGDRPRLQSGDELLLTFGRSADRTRFPFQAGCSFPEILHQLDKGAPVALDDGAAMGRVVSLRKEGVVVAIEKTGPRGKKLKGDKGINFPGTPIELAPLTPEDLDALDVVCEIADMVGYSFVQRASDVALLQGEIGKRRAHAEPLGIIAKIETQLAFRNLPEIAVQAASANPFGIMIARGDLAVEVGFERTSEVQEEMLWLAEAAHVPVVWATQVLESLVKKGMGTRGEYTDAAMGARAECVMLNKGPFIADGVAALGDVLRRAERHATKKTPQLRALEAWRAASPEV
ncbi:pyruvate kinase [Marinivivus vitaminiproducens]|uniref:pyruvate kinase n=1 Tax=Marinivivus vitaminiproducens TaxID=3035935 RepID=UPI0027A20EE4|nr:pyruvate kinase [Geminicoccaceae bacterium SCSIO 64248]